MQNSPCWADRGWDQFRLGKLLNNRLRGKRATAGFANPQAGTCWPSLALHATPTQSLDPSLLHFPIFPGKTKPSPKFFKETALVHVPEALGRHSWQRKPLCRRPKQPQLRAMPQEEDKEGGPNKPRVFPHKRCFTPQQAAHTSLTLLFFAAKSGEITLCMHACVCMCTRLFMHELSAPELCTDQQDSEFPDCEVRDI